MGNALRLFLLAVLLVFAAQPGLRADVAPGDLVNTIVAPSGVSRKAVHAAIVRAAADREWNLVSDKGDRVVLRLFHRGYEANLTLEYDAERIEIFSDSYRVSRSGERREKAVPKGWIENLAKSIRVNLAAAPIERD